MRHYKSIVSLLLFAFVAFKAKSQSLPVGTQVLDDYYRRAQLSGLVDSTVSFTVRPLNPSALGLKNVYRPDVEEKGYKPFDISGGDNATSKFKYTLLPVTLQTQYNTDHPYGWNDGAMIPAKGFQALLSAGLYAEYGPLTIQLQPEFVTAANNSFDTFNKNIYPIIAGWYYDFYNNIDLPARFGTNSYTRVFWGQSSIRLNYKSFSFGLSTENLWWGPGLRNSLLMSNDAPGFKHLTLNTIKPVKTPIGSFEGQLIAGRLENSGYSPLTPNWELFSTPLYVPKPNDWRYLSGIVVSWQPKWVPGLFLGFTSSSQMYGKSLSKFGDYLPFFSQNKSNLGDQEVGPVRDTRSSIFGRWLWKEENAEFYFEYGHNNNTNDFANSLLEPQDARAYIVGLRKLVKFNKPQNEGILISVEATQLAETSVKKVQDANSWYVNKYVRQGYTNLGQSLGAGIGPGGNLQSVDVSWVKGLKSLGLQIERYVHNDDFYYYAFIRSNDWRRHWVDLSAALTGTWNYRNLIFRAKLQYIHSLDYQWYLDPSKEIVGQSYYINGATANNIQMQAGITYRF
ncbi:capsule assembly Wzi family protein [Mucilaginibacter sp. KACC 22063]|uniref:capsule assembly Wzi family protein n=1 Tax=Mucilaginibacter sp. KACC 22063 TaxID=3025666 RepID=UPI00236644B2|nr:capsule assembly Wzi family protein [Mucilaginibacter sp. KACC 22063]WDF54008.1 capsule assembly Wzi family protein [Mucilaginibacter sp. KACC 22063]